MNDIYSFYQLISKYQIEIPIIQRDYAQGRNNPKAVDVRKSLVGNMIKAVKEDKLLFFDFVYGRVDNNKFIPFDGQQRLTTLFLFHKYVFEKCQSDSGCNHKDNCSCGDILGRFSYATRQSSREFCEKLVQKKIISGNSLTDNIKNQSWFYPDWEKDPTVMGMLTMLDEIHCQMRNEADFKTFAEKLTSGCNCPITFHFVDMGEHKMSDETYVKMNARGKTLTPFENFKASSEQYLEENSKSEEVKAKHQELLCRLNGIYNEDLKKYTGIDGTWLDLFWEIKNKYKKENDEKELPDTLMMSFFNRHFMNVWQCWYATNKTKSGKECESLSDEDKKYDEFNDSIKKEMPLFPTKDDFVSFDIYSYVMDKCGVEKCLTPIFNICDALSKTDNKIENDCQAVWNRDSNTNDKWDLFHNDTKDETYKSRAAFYALLKYYEKKQENQEPKLAQWMRIAWNIIENYVEREDSYIPALQLIESIAGKGFDITKLDNKNGVAKDQVNEEIAKAKQIFNEDGSPRQYGNNKEDDKSDYQTWEEIIIAAEKYAFFKGSIRFLFTKEEVGDDWEGFDTKWENAQTYFDCELNDKKLLRTLISYFDSWDNFINIDYDNTATSWKNNLLNTKLIKPIHDFLMNGKLCDFDKYESNLSEYKSIQEQLVKSRLLEELDKSGYYMENSHNLHRYYANRTGDIFLGRNRAFLLSEDIEVDNGCICDDIFYGLNIQFKYDNHFFRWLGNPNDKELDIYLMTSDWMDYFKTSDKNTEEDNYYCFRVDENTTKDSFLESLSNLIGAAKPNGDQPKENAEQ